MERKTIFLALFSAFVACFFVACSNDSDALDINTIDVKAGTRSVGLSSYMTREEIQDRLDEIGEKYGTRVVFENSVNKDSITEDVFMNIEEQLFAYKNNSNMEVLAKKSKDNGSSFFNDSSVDDIMPIAASPSGEAYSGSFDLTISRVYRTIIAIVTWYSDDSRGLTGVNATVQMGDASYIIITSFRQTGGTNSHPYFEYSGDIYGSGGIKMGSFIDYYDGNNSTIFGY